MPKYHVILRQESETIADIEADSEDEAIIRLLIEPNKDFDYKKEEPSQVKPVTTSKIDFFLNNFSCEKSKAL